MNPTDAFKATFCWTSSSGHQTQRIPSSVVSGITLPAPVTGLQKRLLVLVKMRSRDFLKLSPFVGARLVCPLLSTFDHGFHLCNGLGSQLS